MSINSYKPHLLILPEDDANRQMANGFMLNGAVMEKNAQVMPPAGGWKRVVDQFLHDHAPKMRQYPKREILLLVDFDRQPGRLNYIQEQIPADLKNRVFVLGVQTNPEDMKKTGDFSTFEDIGHALANGCGDKTYEAWQHALLKHNQAEVARMITAVRPYLINTPD